MLHQRSESEEAAQSQFNFGSDMMERGLLPQGQAVALVKVMPRQISALGVRVLEGFAIGFFLLGVVLLAANGGSGFSFSLFVALPVVAPLQITSLALILTLYAHAYPSAINKPHAIATVCFAVFGFAGGLIVTPIAAIIDDGYYYYGGSIRVSSCYNAYSPYNYIGTCTGYASSGSIRLGGAPGLGGSAAFFLLASGIFQIALASMEMHAMRTLGDDELMQFRAFQQTQAAATQQQQQQQQAYPYPQPQQVSTYQPVPLYSPASTTVPIYASSGSSGSGYLPVPAAVPVAQQPTGRF